MMKIGDIASYALGDLDSEAIEEIKTSGLNITARITDSAIEVAKRVQSRQNAQIAIVDEQDELVGVVDPVEVVNLYREHSGIDTNLFHEALEIVLQDPGEQSRQFRHEWLGAAKVYPYYCKSGHHRMMTRECPYHNK